MMSLISLRVKEYKRQYPSIVQCCPSLAVVWRRKASVAPGCPGVPGGASECTRSGRGGAAPGPVSRHGG